MGKKQNTGSKSTRRDLARSAVAAYAAAATGIPTKLLARAIPDTSPMAPPGEQRHPEGWRRNWTIPAEYYTDEERHLFDERLVADHFWLMVDHVSRIPDPGDYFVFEYGRSESILIVRGRDNEIRGFYNVCRHRGSRLCRHDDDAIPEDERLSVKQLGQSGSSPVFRCPYHAWTYDTEGSLIYAYGMQEDFDPADNGLIPCHLRAADGFIFVNLSREAEPPDFDAAIEPFRRKVGQRHGTEQLKVGERVNAVMHANWKLALENFLECYHCGPSHGYLCHVHPGSDLTTSGKREWWAQDYVSGTMDGKSAAPLLPAIKRVRVTQSETAAGFSSSYWLGYDDYVWSVRFTPRDVDLTDVECLWLVHPDAKRNVDYDPDHLKELWLVTLLEDIWLCENNHAGIRSGAYRSGRYATHETGRVMPAGFVRWYMAAVAGDIGPALPY
jgi:Rieske 2Fe-2S family protein